MKEKINVKKKINVKEKSVLSFLQSRLVGYNPRDQGPSNNGSNNLHNFMRKEIFFYIDHGFEVGDSVGIELSDRSNMSGKSLKTHYTYTAESYDDISIKMVLSDFQIAVDSDDENLYYCH
jgi:hypothetical protein